MGHRWNTIGHMNLQYENTQKGRKTNLHYLKLPKPTCGSMITSQVPNDK